MNTMVEHVRPADNVRRAKNAEMSNEGIFDNVIYNYAKELMYSVGRAKKAGMTNEDIFDNVICNYAKELMHNEIEKYGDLNVTLEVATPTGGEGCYKSSCSSNNKEIRKTKYTLFESSYGASREVGTLCIESKNIDKLVDILCNAKTIDEANELIVDERCLSTKIYKKCEQNVLDEEGTSSELYPMFKNCTAFIILAHRARMLNFMMQRIEDVTKRCGTYSEERVKEVCLALDFGW